MGRLPLRARAYLLSVLACAALLLWEANPLSNPPRAEAVAVCVVLGLGLILADTHLIELSHATKLGVSTAVEFALLLMVGRGLAVWTIALCVVLTAHWHMRRAWRWYNVAFYAANGVVSIGVAGVVYQQTSSGAPLLTSPLSALGVAMAGVTYFFLNVGIVATMVGLAKNSDTLSSFFTAFQVAAPQFVGLLALGVAAAAVYAASPMAALLLVVPLYGIYTSLRAALTLRTDTKQALEALAIQVDQYHPYTSQHSERVAQYAGKIARRMHLTDEQVDTITRAALIHDLGKLSIWPGMLNKPSALTEEEMGELRTHPARGAELVGKFPDYRNGRDLILHHHERYDGKGYPRGLSGLEIPLGARIIAVADATDAMLSDRPYRKALSISETMKELERNSGKQFDPRIMEITLGILEAEARLKARTTLSRTPVLA